MWLQHGVGDLVHQSRDFELAFEAVQAECWHRILPCGRRHRRRHRLEPLTPGLAADLADVPVLLAA